jgi:hypothetical protein
VEEREIKEENRKIRYLRYLVDFSILSIQQEDLSFEEAYQLVEDVKRAACSLFPGKEEAFELIDHISENNSEKFIFRLISFFMTIPILQSLGKNYVEGPLDDTSLKSSS